MKRKQIFRAVIIMLILAFTWGVNLLLMGREVSHHSNFKGIVSFYLLRGTPIGIVETVASIDSKTNNKLYDSYIAAVVAWAEEFSDLSKDYEWGAYIYSYKIQENGEWKTKYTYGKTYKGTGEKEIFVFEIPANVTAGATFGKFEANEKLQFYNDGEILAFIHSHPAKNLIEIQNAFSAVDLRQWNNTYNLYFNRVRSGKVKIRELEEYMNIRLPEEERTTALEDKYNEFFDRAKIRLLEEVFDRKVSDKAKAMLLESNFGENLDEIFILLEYYISGRFSGSDKKTADKMEIKVIVTPYGRSELLMISEYGDGDTVKFPFMLKGEADLQWEENKSNNTILIVLIILITLIQLVLMIKNFRDMKKRIKKKRLSKIFLFVIILMAGLLGNICFLILEKITKRREKKQEKKQKEKVRNIV